MTAKAKGSFLPFSCICLRRSKREPSLFILYPERFCRSERESICTRQKIRNIFSSGHARSFFSRLGFASIRKMSENRTITDKQHQPPYHVRITVRMQAFRIRKATIVEIRCQRGDDLRCFIQTSHYPINYYPSISHTPAIEIILLLVSVAR